MAKVLYNADYGGIELSAEAIHWLEENGSEETKNKLNKLRKECEGIINEHDYGYPWGLEELMSLRYLDGVERHDKDLISVVENLGEEANGRYANLRLYELKGNEYRIDEYDGLETVIEKCDEKYIHVED